MPSLAVCRCLFRLMRRCFLGRWLCLLVSERFRLVWKCHLFDYSTYIQFCVHWHGSQCQQRLVPNYAVVFRLGWVYSPVMLCHRRVCYLLGSDKFCIEKSIRICQALNFMERKKKKPGPFWSMSCFTTRFLLLICSLSEGKGLFLTVPDWFLASVKSLF